MLNSTVNSIQRQADLDIMLEISLSQSKLTLQQCVAIKENNIHLLKITKSSMTQTKLECARIKQLMSITTDSLQPKLQLEIFNQNRTNLPQTRKDIDPEKVNNGVNDQRQSKKQTEQTNHDTLPSSRNNNSEGEPKQISYPKLEQGTDHDPIIANFVSKQKTLPRYCDIQRSLQTLRNVLPEIFEDNLVDFLYDHIIAKYTKSTAFDSQSSTTRSLVRGDVNPVIGYLQNCQGGITQDRIFHMGHSSSYVPHVVNTLGRPPHATMQRSPFHSRYVQQTGAAVTDQKAYIRRVVARAFCQRSYGLEGLQEDILEYNQHISINHINYEGIMKQLALNTIRTLESFLLNECQLNIIHLLRRFDQGQLVNCLLHCRVNFNGEICQIIFNIIKGLCQLSKVTVTEADAVKLYNAIQSKMNAGPPEIQDYQTVIRNIPSRPASTYEPPMVSYSDFTSKVFPLRKGKGKRSEKRAQAHDFMEQIWTSSHEARFVEMYRSGTSLAHIRDTFKKEYPRESLVFTVSSLRSKLYRIVRTAIKKLYYYYDKHKDEGLPELVKLDDNKMKVIIHNTVGRLARKFLLEVYNLAKYDEKIITQAINGIMECLKKERMENEITLAHSRTSNESDDDYEEVMKKMRLTESD